MSFYLYKVLRNANEHIVTERKSVVVYGWRMEQRRRGYRGTPLNTFDGFIFLMVVVVLGMYACQGLPWCLRW